jgi:hypothetical protein
MINMVRRAFNREGEEHKGLIYLLRCLVEGLLEKKDHRRENRSNIV